MGKTFRIGAVIFVLIIIGVVYLLTSGGVTQPDNTLTSTGSTNQQTSTGPVPQQNTSSAQEGSYVDYQDDIIASTSGTKLLFFHAPWCPQCRDLEATIQKEGVPGGVTIIKVDYDTSRDLRQKYGVTLQTTVVRVDDNGNLVEKFVAYDDPSISAVKNNLL